MHSKWTCSPSRKLKHRQLVEVKLLWELFCTALKTNSKTKENNYKRRDACLGAYYYSLIKNIRIRNLEVDVRPLKLLMRLVKTEYWRVDCWLLRANSLFICITLWHLWLIWAGECKWPIQPLATPAQWFSTAEYRSATTPADSIFGLLRLQLRSHVLPKI